MGSIYRVTGIVVGAGTGFAFGYGAGLLGQAVSDNPTVPSSLYFLLLVISAVITGIMTKGWLATLVLFCVGGPCIGLAIATGGEWEWEKFTEFGPYYLSLVVSPFVAFGALVGYGKAAGLCYRIAQLVVWPQSQRKAVFSQAPLGKGGPASLASITFKCLGCRNTVPANANYCAYCGSRLPHLKPAPSVQTLPVTPIPAVQRAKRGVPTWTKWVIGLAVVGLAIALVHGITFHPFADPLDKAYEGAYKWAKHNLPSEKYVSIPQSGFPTDAIQSMESEVTYCMVIGKHAWAIAYYGLRSYSDTRINPRASLRELFPPTGYILYSSDGGERWEIQKQIPNWRPFQLKFVTETEGYAVGDSGILYTSESGKHWSFLALSLEIQKIEGVESIEGHHLVIACNDDWVKYESSDGGKTWQKRSE